MSKRPFPEFTQASPAAAASPAGTASVPHTPGYTGGSLSPIASRDSLQLPPLQPSKRRKVTMTKTSSLSINSSNQQQREDSVLTPQPSASTPAAQPNNNGEDHEDDDDEEDEEGVAGGKPSLIGDFKQRKKEDQANKEKIRLLMQHFDAQQMDRYEHLRGLSSNLNKSNIKRLANAILQQSVEDRIVVATRGLAKIFIGEMTEQALENQKKRGGSGPLTTCDLKEAYRSHLADKDRGGSERRKKFIR